MTFYRMSLPEIAREFKVNLQQGLSHTEAQARFKQYGPNALPEQPVPSLFQVFFEQFKNPLIYLLVIAAIIIIFMGNYTDALVTLVVVIFNAIVGTFYERKAQRTLQELKRLMKVSALVIRDDQRIIIEAQDLVPGDLIFVQEGDQIPADARVIKAEDIRVNESVLTGESISIEKHADAYGQASTSLAVFEQNNMVFRGTTVTSGSAYALVVATGAHTEIGKIQKATEEHASETPLQKELHRLSHTLVFVAIGLCVLLFIIGLATGKPLSELLGLLTALFIGMVPEGLPVVFAIALTAGAYRLAQKHLLVKRLPAAEGLGRIDVIVIDKTGTLTRNEMIARKLYALQESYTISGEGYSPQGSVASENTESENIVNLALIGQAAVLLDSTEKKYDEKRKAYQIKGEPTEAALGVMGQKILNFSNHDTSNYEHLFDLPFEFSLRLRLAFFKYLDGDKEKIISFISGAPEAVIAACTNTSSEVEKKLNELLEQGFRVIGLAYYQEDFSVYQKAVELSPEQVHTKQWWLDYFSARSGQFKFLALVGIEDEIRSEVKDAIAKTRAAGINVVMATGDHKSTATHIARYTGILKPGDRVMTGPEFNALSEQERMNLDIESITVFARVTPQDKLTIVDLFKKRGKRVAMTGDGINDVPSIAAADIGIAMGLAGTDVAKEAADLVLLDDSFLSIVHALEEGRHIFATLRRVVWYFFSTNLSEVLIVVYAFLVGLPLPLRAAQILWLNVVTDGFLDVALALEPHEKGVLKEEYIKSRSSQRLLDGSLGYKILIDAAVMTIGSLALFYMTYKTNLTEARTMMLICMAMFQWFNAWNCRSENLSIAQKGLWTNKWLIMATAVVFALQLLVVYVPVLQVLFKTVPLSLSQWLIILAISSSIVVVEEVRKAIVRARVSKRQA